MVSGLWRFTPSSLSSKGPTADDLCRRGWKSWQLDGRRKKHSRGLVVIFFLLGVLSVKIGCTVFSLI